MGSREYESIGEYFVVKVTDQAIGIDTGEVDEKGNQKLQWIPKSLVSYGYDLEEGEEYDIEVEEWFAEKEELI